LSPSPPYPLLFYHFVLSSTFTLPESFLYLSPSFSMYPLFFFKLLSSPSILFSTLYLVFFPIFSSLFISCLCLFIHLSSLSFPFLSFPFSTQIPIHNHAHSKCLFKCAYAHRDGGMKNDATQQKRFRVCQFLRMCLITLNNVSTAPAPTQINGNTCWGARDIHQNDGKNANSSTSLSPALLFGKNKTLSSGSNGQLEVLNDWVVLP